MPNPLNSGDNVVGKSLQDPSALVTLLVAHSVTVTSPAHKTIRILRIDELCVLNHVEDGSHRTNSFVVRNMLLRLIR